MKAKHGKRMRRAIQRRSAEERERLIAEYRASGLSRREFAQQNGINPLTFHGWFNKKLRRPGNRNSEVKFVEASVVAPRSVGIRATLELPKGGRLRIEGLSVEDLAGLIREAGRC